VQPIAIVLSVVTITAGILLFRNRDDVFDYFQNLRSGENPVKNSVSPGVRKLVPIGWIVIGALVVVGGLVFPSQVT
jgi:hypothetical protein